MKGDLLLSSSPTVNAVERMLRRVCSMYGVSNPLTIGCGRLLVISVGGESRSCVRGSMALPLRF